jgi:hypothetical protein
MGFLKIIRLGIAFCVIFTFILIIRWTVLPHLKVFVHALPPTHLWKGAWDVAISAGMQLMPYIITTFVILYFIYKIVSKIPIIGKIIVKIPPFPDLKRSGIFNLLDGLFGIIFSRSSLKDRLHRFAYAIGAFIEANFKFAADTTDEVLGITDKINRLNNKIKIPTSINLTNGKGSTDLESEEITAVENPLLSDEQREVSDKYQQCIAENIEQLTPDMSKEDKAHFINRNRITQIQCKAQKLQTSLSFITNKFL